MTLERSAAGLWCSEVLDRLSDYLDDELTAGERGQVEAHLAACDLCERFGGEMAELVGVLRRHLGRTPGEESGDLWARRFLRALHGSSGGESS